MILLYPCTAWAAITHQNSTSSVSSVNATQCSFSHVGGSSPTIALFWIALDANETITGTPTYGGANMTLIAETTVTGSADQKVWLYELHSPATGTQTMEADFSEDNHHTCMVQTYNGTSVSDATIETDTFDNAGAACTTGVTTINLNATTNFMATFSSWQGGDTAPFTETNFTTIEEGCTNGNTGSDDCFDLGDSTGNSGNLTHTVTPTVTDECAQISVELTDAGSRQADTFLVME